MSAFPELPGVQLAGYLLMACCGWALFPLQQSRLLMVRAGASGLLLAAAAVTGVALLSVFAGGFARPAAAAPAAPRQF